MTDMSERTMVVRIGESSLRGMRAGLADLLCWARGFDAAFSGDELDRRGVFAKWAARDAAELLDRAQEDRPPPVEVRSLRQQIERLLGTQELEPVDAVGELVERIKDGTWSRAAGATPSAPSPGNFAVGKRQGLAVPAGWIVQRIKPDPVDSLDLEAFLSRDDAERFRNRSIYHWSYPAPVYFAEVLARAAAASPESPKVNVVGHMCRDGDEWCFSAELSDIEGWKAKRPKAGPIVSAMTYAGEIELPIDPKPFGWMVQTSSMDAVRYVYPSRELAESRHAEHGPAVPVFTSASARPLVEEDWPREITPAMQRAYAERYALALEAGETQDGAIKAVLEEFMASHRPGIASKQKAEVVAWKVETRTGMRLLFWDFDSAQAQAGNGGTVTALYE
jgi:hypothetical protein